MTAGLLTTIEHSPEPELRVDLDLRCAALEQSVSCPRSLVLRIEHTVDTRVNTRQQTLVRGE